MYVAQSIFPLFHRSFTNRRALHEIILVRNKKGLLEWSADVTSIVHVFPIASSITLSLEQTPSPFYHSLKLNNIHLLEHSL